MFPPKRLRVPLQQEIVLAAMEVQRATVHFLGHVQGVGFRYAALQVAREFEVAGFVQNLPDGRVLAEVEGRPDEVTAYVAAVEERMQGFVRKTDRSVRHERGAIFGLRDQMSAEAVPLRRVWLAAARPRTLPAAVAPVLVGSALAFHDGRFRPGTATLCLAFAVLVQIGANFANDYYDFVQGADTCRAARGPKRAVASGWVKPAAMRAAMLAVFAAAILAGAGLILRGGPWMAAVGFASVLSAIAYTGGPFPLGYHGLGDLFVFVFFGLVAVTVTYFVQAGRVSREAVLAAVPVGLLTANILVVNNYRDMETDAAAGKRTLVVKFGRGFARGQYAGLDPGGAGGPLRVLVPGLSAGLPAAAGRCSRSARWRLYRRLQAGRTPAGADRAARRHGEAGGGLRRPSCSRSGSIFPDETLRVPLRTPAQAIWAASLVFSAAFGSMPTIWSTSLPPLNTSIVGIARMLYSAAISL